MDLKELYQEIILDHAKKNNISFEIYESSGQVGGNCKTIVDGDFRFDIGAHRFHDKNNDATVNYRLST